MLDIETYRGGENLADVHMITSNPVLVLSVHIHPSDGGPILQRHEKSTPPVTVTTNNDAYTVTGMIGTTDPPTTPFEIDATCPTPTS